jgi:hypothetical protein
MIHHFSYNFFSITCMIMNDLIGIHHHIYTTTESEHTFTCGSNLQYMFSLTFWEGTGLGRPSEIFCLLYIPFRDTYFIGISLRGVVLFANMGYILVSFPGRVIIIYVFQATEIEWGNKGRGAILLSGTPVFNPFCT